jgi:hypothetical protein
MEDDINKTIVVPRKGVTMGPMEPKKEPGPGRPKKDTGTPEPGYPSEFDSLTGDANKLAKWIWKNTSKIETPDTSAKASEVKRMEALIGKSGVSDGFKVILCEMMSIVMKTPVGTEKLELLPQIPKGIMVVPYVNTNGCNYPTGEPTLITVRNGAGVVGGMRLPEGRVGDNLRSEGSEIRPATPAEIVKFVGNVGAQKIITTMGLVII